MDIKKHLSIIYFTLGILFASFAFYFSLQTKVGIMRGIGGGADIAADGGALGFALLSGICFFCSTYLISKKWWLFFERHWQNREIKPEEGSSGIGATCTIRQMALMRERPIMLPAFELGSWLYPRWEEETPGLHKESLCACVICQTHEHLSGGIGKADHWPTKPPCASSYLI